MHITKNRRKIDLGEVKIEKKKKILILWFFWRKQIVHICSLLKQMCTKFLGFNFAFCQLAIIVFMRIASYKFGKKSKVDWPLSDQFQGLYLDITNVKRMYFNMSVSKLERNYTNSIM